MQHNRNPANLADLELVADKLERAVVLWVRYRVNELLVPRMTGLDVTAVPLLFTPAEEAVERFG